MSPGKLAELRLASDEQLAQSHGVVAADVLRRFERSHRTVVVHFAEGRNEVPVLELAEAAGVSVDVAEDVVAGLVELGLLHPREDGDGYDAVSPGDV
jgi:hypothetical protein